MPLNRRHKKSFWQNMRGTNRRKTTLPLNVMKWVYITNTKSSMAMCFILGKRSDLNTTIGL